MNKGPAYVQKVYAGRLGVNESPLPEWTGRQFNELSKQGEASSYSTPPSSILPDGDAARKLASMEKNLSGQSLNTNPATGVSDDVERIGNLVFGTKNLTPEQRSLIESNIINRDSPALMSSSAVKVAKSELERRFALNDWNAKNVGRKAQAQNTMLKQYKKWEKNAKPSMGGQATAGAGFFVPGMIARATVSEPEAETQFQKSGETTPGAEYYFPRTYRFPMIGDTKIPAGTAYYNNEALKLGGVGRYVIDPDWMTNDPDAQ